MESNRLHVLYFFFFLCVWGFGPVRSSVTKVYAQTLIDYVITLIINVLTVLAPEYHCVKSAGTIGAR